MALQPAPYQDIKDLPMSVQMWYNQIKTYISAAAGTIPWVTVSKAGANITDIPLRDHNNLTNIQGGAAAERYHLTAAQYAGIGGATTTVSSPVVFLGEDHGMEDWLHIPGPTGIQGTTGSTGATGVTGVGTPGNDGADGEDALHIPGPQGLQGLQGTLGPPGNDGSDSEDLPWFPHSVNIPDPFIGSYAPGSFSVTTGKYAIMSYQLQLTGTQYAVLTGTAQLRIT